MQLLQVDALSFIGRRGYVAGFCWGDEENMRKVAQADVSCGLAFRDTREIADIFVVKPCVDCRKNATFTGRRFVLYRTPGIRSRFLLG